MRSLTIVRIGLLELWILCYWKWLRWETSVIGTACNWKNIETGYLHLTKMMTRWVLDRCFQPKDIFVLSPIWNVSSIPPWFYCDNYLTKYHPAQKQKFVWWSLINASGKRPKTKTKIGLCHCHHKSSSFEGRIITVKIILCFFYLFIKSII